MSKFYWARTSSSGESAGGYWQERAACLKSPQEDKDLFTGGAPRREDAYYLKHRYCDKCPVILQCATWAANDKAFLGVAAGRVFSGDGGKNRNTYRIGG